MKKARVTIGISCYNCLTYLPWLVRSLASQSFDDWEAIAIDDASTDGTTEYLRSLNHPRIRVVLGNQNLGLGPRLNQIAQLAETEFVARTDADDLMHPERLRKQMECFDEDPSLDVCATGTYTIDNCNRILGIRRIPSLARTPLEVMRRNGPSHPTVTAKRGWFLRFPYSGEPRRGEDLDLWIRSVASSRILQLDEPLHFIREDSSFDAGKYRRSMRDHRMIYGRHAALAGSTWAHLSLVAGSFMKELIYSSLSAAGLAGRLAGRRNRAMSKSEAVGVQALLAHIWEVPLSQSRDAAPDRAEGSTARASPLSQEA